MTKVGDIFQLSKALEMKYNCVGKKIEIACNRLLGVRCNVESANLEILNVEAMNVEYYYEFFATLPNERNSPPQALGNCEHSSS